MKIGLCQTIVDRRQKIYMFIINVEVIRQGIEDIYM